MQAALFGQAGVTKIRLTGGEPTLRRDITALTTQLAALPGISHVGITTNGIALARKLPDLRAAGETVPLVSAPLMCLPSKTCRILGLWLYGPFTASGGCAGCSEFPATPGQRHLLPACVTVASQASAAL